MDKKCFTKYGFDNEGLSVDYNTLGAEVVVDELPQISEDDLRMACAVCGRQTS